MVAATADANALTRWDPTNAEIAQLATPTTGGRVAKVLCVCMHVLMSVNRCMEPVRLGNNSHDFYSQHY